MNVWLYEAKQKETSEIAGYRIWIWLRILDRDILEVMLNRAIYNQMFEY